MRHKMEYFLATILLVKEWHMNFIRPHNISILTIQLLNEIN